MWVGPRMRSSLQLTRHPTPRAVDHYTYDRNPDFKSCFKSCLTLYGRTKPNVEVEGTGDIHPVTLSNREKPTENGPNASIRR